MTSVDLSSRKYSKFLTTGKPKLLRLAVAQKKVSSSLPHVSSVWYLWKNGIFWVTTSDDRLKVKTIRRNKHVALIVDTDVIPYEGIIVEGTATITRRHVKEVTKEIVRRYLPEKLVEGQYDELMRYPRILLRIRPKKTLGIMSYKHR